MNTIESLHEKLSGLITSRRSGIVSLCGSAAPIAEGDPFWENHEALVYIEPLDTVVAFLYWGITYQNGCDALSGDVILKNFADRDDDGLTPEDFGLDERTYLDVCTDCLLNDMAHDGGECPRLARLLRQEPPVYQSELQSGGYLRY